MLYYLNVILINILFILIHVTNETIRKFVLFYLKNLTSTKQQIVCFMGRMFFPFFRNIAIQHQKIITIEG